MRNFAYPGRSPVYGTRAMCATSHPLASVAAIEQLKKGGNAVDAAIAATAVLCVVEHAMTGIGGDCFAIIAKPGTNPVALNASGRAPMAATPDWYAKQGIKSIVTQSPHAVTVPGAIDGWAMLLKDYGTRTLADVLAPAIEYAEGGFVVSPRVGHDWGKLAEKLSKHPGARQHLLPGGRPPKVGEIVRFSELGKTLRAIATKGRDAFYTGDIAADMVAELRELGGLHTMEDFAAQNATYVEPISVKYRGADLYEMPPNNQGIIALIMLRILDRLGTLGTDPLSVERYHVMSEASRLAYAMRDTFVADPVMANVPVEHMLSDATINELASRIDRKMRRDDLGPVPQPTGTDTIYLTVVDSSGMAVSFINSLFSGFGTGIVTRKTGITFQNRGQGFVLDPKHRNCIAPGKRPMHTLVPAMAFKDGKPWMSFGVMGANFQPMGHAYVMTNILDYGMDAQEALDHPRAFFEDGHLQLEKSMPKAVYEGLAAAGHPVMWREDPWGGGQIVQIDSANGILIGASDPRKDGMAVGY
jgi:gamma-glutamyltranspeptidase / glutathione hydrolase